MTKVPAAGKVKTRLEPRLQAEQCATLAACFLRDTVNKARRTRIPLIIAFSPSEEREILSRILPHEQNFVEQIGENLGEKMFKAFEFAFSGKADAAVMIGTDSPTFPVEFIWRAFELLSENDAVLGETTDGGFYLIGLKTRRREIFEAVEWSSPRTFTQTARNIRKLNLKLALLPVWYDVDTPADFERLRADLTIDSHAAPQSSEFVRNLDE